jgi:hypothetical protein
LALFAGLVAAQHWFVQDFPDTQVPNSGPLALIHDQLRSQGIVKCGRAIDVTSVVAPYASIGMTLQAFEGWADRTFSHGRGVRRLQSVSCSQLSSVGQKCDVRVGDDPHVFSVQIKAVGDRSGAINQLSATARPSC